MGRVIGNINQVQQNKPQQGFDLGGLLKGAENAVQGIGNVLAPRTTNLLGTDLKTGHIPGEPTYTTSSKGDLGESLKRTVASTANFAKQTAGAGSELAMYALPGGKVLEGVEGAAGLSKIGPEIINALARFGLPGAVYGATDPRKMSGGQRAGEAVGSGLLSTAGGPLVEGLLNKIGLGAGKMAINPEVNTEAAGVFNVPQAKNDIVKEALGQTSGLDLETIAKQMGQKVTDTSKQITDSLSGINKKYSFSTDIEDQLSAYVRNKVKGLPARGFGDLIQPFKDAINAVGEQDVNKVGDFTHSLSGLFDSRKAIDRLVKSLDENAFSEGSKPLEVEVGKATRSFLKDFINKEADKHGVSGISDLTEMESRLYSAGKGIAGKPNMGSNSAPRSLQGLGMRSLYGPSLIPVARAATSPAVQGEALMKLLGLFGIK